MTLTNGNFEVSRSGSPYAKGTYTTSDGSMTSTVTHIHGGLIGAPLESKWYSRNDLKSAFGAFITDEALDSYFFTNTGPYAVTGNTLTMVMGGEPETYTRE